MLMKKVYLKPLIISLLYLYLTLLLYFFGEYRWNIDNKIQLASYVSVCYLFLGVGGIIALKITSSDNVVRIPKVEIDFYVLLRLSYVYSIIAYTIMSYYYGQGFLNIFNASLISEVYLEKAQSFTYERSILVQFFSWFWLLTYIYTPFSIIFWEKIKRKDKIMFVVTIIFCISYWLSIGTMKGIGDLVIQLLISIEIRRQIQNNKVQKTANFKKNLKVFMLIFICIMLFSSIQQSRSIAVYGNSESLERLPYVILPFIEDTRDYPIDPSIKRLMFYLSHGYTGLALSLKENHEWTHFVGFSRSLSEIYEARTSDQVLDKTYLSRIEKDYGWPNGMMWSTLFPWIAGDISFYFIPILMLLIGFIFIRLWKKILNDLKNNLISVLYFTQISILIIYTPMNNQIFQSRQSLFTIILLVFLSVFCKIKLEKKEVSKNK